MDKPTTPDRVPPQSVDLEMCVLGAIMLDPVAALEVATNHLTPNSFYLEGHTLLFKLMQELQARGIPPDMNAVLDELRSRKLLDKVGGSGVIMGMLNSVPTAANVEYHSKKLAEKFSHREIIITLTLGIDAVYRQEIPYQDIIETTTTNLRKLLSAGTVEVPTVEVLADLQAAYAALDTPVTQAGPTGLKWLDETSGGIAPQELWAVMGAPNTGKTRIGLSQAVFQAQTYQVCWINLEMSFAKWWAYLASSVSSTGVFPVNPGQLFKEGPGDIREGRWRDVFSCAENLTLRIMHRPEGASCQLLSLMCQDAIDQGAKVIHIDQYQRIQEFSQGQREDNRGMKGQAIHMLADIAKANNITIFVYHQSKREGYENPTLSSSFDTSAIEQVCDHNLFYVDLQRNLLTSHKGFCVLDTGYPVKPTAEAWKEFRAGNPDAVHTETTWVRPVELFLTKTRGPKPGRTTIMFNFAWGCRVEKIAGTYVPCDEINIVPGVQKELDHG